MENKKINFNLQFFAEGEPNSDSNESNVDNQPTPAQDEVAKLKARLDELTKSEKKLKNQLKEKMTEDEKKASLEQETQQRFSDYESRLEDYELKESLLKDGVFTSEEANKIIENKKDTKSLIASISNLYKAKIEQAKKDAIAEYMRSSNIKGGTSTDNEDPELEMIKKMAQSHKTKKESKFFK